MAVLPALARTSLTSSARRNDGINALRGVAVALVMLRHAFPHQFAGAGVVGVVMFFTLSGNLITTVLLTELRRHGRIRLRRFALRRAARLVPALVVMMATLTAVTLLIDPLGDRNELVRTTLVAFTWTADLPFSHGSDAIFHLWTLAIEEQFYVLWPLTLLVAWRTKKLGLTIGLIGGVSAALCVLSLVWAGPRPDLVYTFPTSWWLCFAIGAASAIFRDRVRIPTVLWPFAGFVLLALSVFPLRGHSTTYFVWAPLIALLTAALVAISRREWGTISLRLLRPLTALGAVSYAAYLWDYPLTLWLRGSFAGAELVAAALTVAAASLSWWLVEKPIARLAQRVWRTTSVG